MHSFEEGFYLLSGEAVVTINGTSYQLRPGDYAAVKVGTPHAWRAVGSPPVRWLQMAAPQPKPAGAERDTFFLKDRAVPDVGAAAWTCRISNGNLLGHFDAGQIPPVRRAPGRSLTGLEGVFLKWLIDENFGARHHRLLFIEYQPGVGIGLHDHTFEEAYFILSGEVEGTLDGKTYRGNARRRPLDGRRLRPRVRQRRQRAGALARDVRAAAAEGKCVPLHGGMGDERAKELEG